MEDFLLQKHHELYPTILDDELPDAFNDWLGNLDAEDWMKYAEEYVLSSYPLQKKRIDKEYHSGEWCQSCGQELLDSKN